jgi:hypothetical protein
MAIRCFVRAFVVVVCLLAIGCSSVKRSDTARTAREQFLISNAVDQSLGKCDFSAFRNTKVFVEDKYLECIDKGYIVGSIRHRLLLNGATIAAKPEESDVVLETRSGGVGTDNADSYVGIPEIVLPGMLTLPEVRLWQKSRQSALAKIGIVAYDAKNHEMLGAGGVSSSMANDSNTFVFGIGPFQSGSAKSEIQRTTGRQMGQPNQELPTIVAFSGRSERDGSGKLQLTGNTQEQK